MGDKSPKKEVESPKKDIKEKRREKLEKKSGKGAFSSSSSLYLAHMRTRLMSQ